MADPVASLTLTLTPDPDPNPNQAHLWHPGLDHRQRRARHSLAALELPAVTQQQRAAHPVRSRPALRACRVRVRVEGRVRPDPNPNLQTPTPPPTLSLTLTRLGHVLLDELETVARAEDVEVASLGQTPHGSIEQTGPCASSGRAWRLWAARCSHSPSEGTMRQEPGRWVASQRSRCSSEPPPSRPPICTAFEL